MSNKYFFRAKISDEKFKTVLRLFCLDMEAKKIAEFTGLNQNTVNIFTINYESVLPSFVSRKAHS